MRDESVGVPGGVKRRLARFADVLGMAERYVTAALMIAMTALYALNVLVRLLLPRYASAFAWIDEASRYMLVWAVFLAAGLTLEVGRHVSLDLVHGKLGPRATRALFAVIDVVGFVFSAGAAFYSLQLVLFVARTGQMSPTLGVPAWILYGAPFAGFLSLAFRYLLRLANVRDARRSPVHADWLGSGLA
jgi:TRAP-type C4-dicarboxylate transport system permease small subunit